MEKLNIDNDEFLVENGRLFEVRTKKAKIIIPEGVESLDSKFYDTCGKVSEIVFPSTFKYLLLLLGLSSTGVSKCILSEGVEQIGCYSFCDCASLVSIVIPRSTIRLGERVFEGAYNLENITLYDTLCVVENNALVLNKEGDCISNIILKYDSYDGLIRLINLLINSGSFNKVREREKKLI